VSSLYRSNLEVRHDCVVAQCEKLGAAAATYLDNAGFTLQFLTDYLIGELQAAKYSGDATRYAYDVTNRAFDRGYAAAKVTRVPEVSDGVVADDSARKLPRGIRRAEVAQ